MSLYRDIARNLLLSPDFLESMTDRLANEIEKQLTAHAGGDTIYIPKVASTTSRSDRDEKIRADFKGDNLEELAREHELTPRQVRRILQKKK